MTKEKFTELLENGFHKYSLEGEKVIVKGHGSVYLDKINEIYTNVEFRNNDHVYLNSLKFIPKGIRFYNGNNIYLSDVYLDLQFPWMFPFYIEGIGIKSLFNKMISLGLFDKGK
jgi:hypothetical protein